MHLHPAGTGGLASAGRVHCKDQPPLLSLCHPEIHVAICLRGFSLLQTCSQSMAAAAAACRTTHPSLQAGPTRVRADPGGLCLHSSAAAGAAGVLPDCAGDARFGFFFCAHQRTTSPC